MRSLIATCIAVAAIAGGSLSVPLVNERTASATGVQAPPPSLRLISREGTRTLPIVLHNNQEYVALDDLTQAFGLTAREDRPTNALTITARNRSIILTADQSVASVGGRLVSMVGTPTRRDNTWLLPLDFLPRALGPALETRFELRRAARVVIVGDLRVPRVVARVETAPAATSVTFEVTPATTARVTSDAGRLVVAFDADALDLVLPSLPAQEYLQSLQPGDAPATVRIATGPKFAAHRLTSTQPDASSARVVLELLPAAPEPAPTPAPTPTPPAPAAPAPAPSDLPPFLNPTPATGVRAVVIDPGHGGDELGTHGSRGTQEKDVTLAVARRLRTQIETRLGLRVYLTRDEDRTMSLDERSAYANSQKADVFISIHANAALRPGRRGAEVYYLSLDRAEAEARRMAAASGPALPVLGGGTRSIDLILWETAQARYLEQSSTLANFIEQALRGKIPMSPRPVQQAPFRVLVGANMPAVLVEIGYLSNPEEEQLLGGAQHQDLIAQALLDAIVQFREFVDRSAPATRSPGPVQP